VLPAPPPPLDQRPRRRRLARIALALTVALVAVVAAVVAFARPHREATAMPVTLDVTQWVVELAAPAGGPAREVPITFPGHFDAVFPRDSEVVLRTEVELPPALRGQALTLSIPSYGGRASLEAEGRPTSDVALDLFDGYRSRGPHAYEIPAEHTRRERLALTLRVKNVWSQASWFPTVPRLHETARPDPRVRAVRIVNDALAAVAGATLAQIGLTYLVAYALGRRNRAHVLFAVQVISASYYHVYCLGVSQWLFGTYDVAMTGTLITIAPISAVYVTHAQYGLPSPSRIWLVLAAIAIGTAWVFSGPYDQVVATAPCVLVMLCVMAYQIVTLGRLTFRRPRPFGAETVLVAWIVLAIPSAAEGIYWFQLADVLDGVRADCIGLLGFALLQSFLLGREHILSMLRTDELNAVLADRVDLLEAGRREIENLNSELRRQIADRSRQLFDALGLLAAPGRAASAIAVGDVVQDRYRITRPIAEGGMGAVFEAERLTDRRRVALKVAHDPSSAVLARLAREAHIASRVQHPNVVSILDVDIGASGLLFVVLELVDGSSLVREKARFADPSWAASVLRQAAAGLAAMHAHGIVHRDLKPANVLVAREAGADGAPRVKLADFGISRVMQAVPQPHPESATVEVGVRRIPSLAALLADEDGDADDGTPATVTLPRKGPTGRAALTPTPSSMESPLTEAGQLVGTPVYIAPELGLDPQRLCPMADMFSFGVMAYQCLTGRLPFAESPALARHRGVELPAPLPLSTARPDLDEALVALLERCLSLDPNERPTADEVAAEPVERTSRAA